MPDSGAGSVRWRFGRNLPLARDCRNRKRRVEAAEALAVFGAGGFPEVVVIAAGDGPEGLGAWGGFVKLAAQAIGDGLVVVAVDDEERHVDVGDPRFRVEAPDRQRAEDRKS